MTDDRLFFRIDGIAAGYRGQAVIDGICLDVRPGEIIALIGPNGAGKSTILKAITAELSLMAGAVRTDTGEIHAMPAAERAKKEAVVLTERIRPELMTVREVVEMGRYPYTGHFGKLSEEDRAEAEKALALMDLTELADCDYNELSDGQKQRVLIARAAAQAPEVLILDEPTSYLDVRYRLSLMRILKTMARTKNMSIISTLHEVELALALADRILCIRDGKAVYLGTPAELREGGILNDLFDVAEGDADAEAVYPWLVPGRHVRRAHAEPGAGPAEPGLKAGKRRSGGRAPFVMIAFTETGAETMNRLAEEFRNRFPDRETVTAVRSSAHPEISIRETAGEFTRKWFGEAEALFFFGAAGIAVRAIAPLAGDKFSDPAVIVIDERGSFCIPVLSGHLGGANSYASLAAEILGAVPVITTATDGRSLFSPDGFARARGMALRMREGTDGVRDALLRFSSAVLRADDQAGENDASGADAGKPSIFADRDVLSADERKALVNARGVVFTENREQADLVVSAGWSDSDADGALYLVPRCLAVGIGCRKGVTAEEVAAAVEQVFRENRLFPEGCAGAASVDLKAEEQGLLDYCRQQALKAVFYTPEELQKVTGTFSASEFVREVTGTDNVCERSAAALAGKDGRRIAGKTVCGRVTVSVYVIARGGTADE